MVLTLGVHQLTVKSLLVSQRRFPSTRMNRITTMSRRTITRLVLGSTLIIPFIYILLPSSPQDPPASSTYESSTSYSRSPKDYARGFFQPSHSRLASTISQSRESWIDLTERLPYTSYLGGERLVNAHHPVHRIMIISRNS